MTSDNEHSTLCAAIASCLAVVGVLISGCGDGTRADSGKQLATEVLFEAPSGETLRYDPRSAAVFTASGQRVPVVDGEATIGDVIVVVDRDGSASVHRTPSSIVEESNKQPKVYLKTGTNEPIVVDGFRGPAYVDPADGAICWIALTCSANSCVSSGEDGGPLQFVSPLADAQVAPDGRISYSADANPTDKLPICPHCGKDTHVVRYETLQVASRRAELSRELEAVRAARDQRAK